VIWDQVADVICIGRGVAVLASAISVIDADGEVFVADLRSDNGSNRMSAAARPQADRVHWLEVDVSDSETSEYFAELTSDLGPLKPSARNVELSVRAVRRPPPVDPRAPVAPFIGARLREWAAGCLVSPYGFLYTPIWDRPTTTLQTVDGDEIEVAEIGSMTPDSADVGGSVVGWLRKQARDRLIEARADRWMQRIVFEDGLVMGAVITTPDGLLAVRARHGVMVSPGASLITTSGRQQLIADNTELRLCLVGQAASRFGRLELLTSVPVTGESPLGCVTRNRQLPNNMRETRKPSEAWRCGKVYGYPSLGQE
jgi:hypothetical protein